MKTLKLPSILNFNIGHKCRLAALTVFVNTVMIFMGLGNINIIAQPVIASFSPMSGSIGSNVIIRGSNFNVIPSKNVVFFGATQTAVDSATSTELHVLVPAGATFQNISVTNLADNLTAYSSKPFVVTFPFCGPFDNTSVSPEISFPACPFPNELKVCDFDGDGKPDIILRNFNDTILLFKNTSSNEGITFSSRIGLYAGPYPKSITINDFDGDGKPDFAVSINIGDFDSIISVFRNISTPGVLAFAPKVNFFGHVDIYKMASADFDRDGKPDLVINSNDNNDVFVLRNLSSVGNISFAAPIKIGSANLGSMSVSDFDGDGFPDLAITDYGANCVSVFLNTSSSPVISFNPGHIYYTGLIPIGITTGDIDGDGRTDIITGSEYYNTISVLKNYSTIGNVVFSTGVDYPASWVDDIAAGDLNGDGRPDIAAINYADSFVSVLINTSANGSISFAPEVEFPTGINPESISLSDLDGDGKSDIVVPCQKDSTFAVLRNHTIPAAPNICMVTVDSTSTNNIIFWDNSQYDKVDSFIVYRETMTDIYKRIGSVLYSSADFFIDTVRQLYFPYTGDPNVGSYRYKLQIRDTCGNYSELSPYHNTLFISNTGSVFFWNDYKVEGKPVPLPQLSGYQLFRDNYANGTWNLIAGVSGNQLSLSDTDYSTWPNALRRVEAIWTTSCISKGPDNISRSNISGLKPNGVFENNESSNITVSISPNPFSDETIIRTNFNLIKTSLTIYDITGKKLKQFDNLTGQKITLYRENLPAGLYFIQLIKENKIRATGKFAIKD